MLSDVMEDYLKAIYRLEREVGGPVGTGNLADHLGVTPPTVTSMLEKLEERELVEREKYKGAELTLEGETVALEVLRHHRLLESFLTAHLDYEWTDVHEEADALEHHISEEFERRMAEKLGEPEVDPHGDPIPNADLDPLGEEETATLADCDEGDRVVVARVNDRGDDELSYLAAAGIEPGAELEVVDVAPIGLYVVRGAVEETHLPESVAGAIRVRGVDADRTPTVERA